MSKVLKAIPAGTHLCDVCGTQEAPYVCTTCGGDFCQPGGCTEGCHHTCIPREKLPYRFKPFTNDYKERWGGTRDCIKHLELTAYCNECFGRAKSA